MEVEKLDILNIIEIQRIRSLLSKDKDLLSLFELLVELSNDRINKKENTIEKNIIIEDNIEPDLSSDSEDDLLIED
tara:strand:+ start:3653 stop:3880 length:228 start_codon:yes stop_codon:yes gene_type:complete